MNEFLRNFIMTGIRDMVKRGVVLYQTYQYASGWFDKGVLMQEDLEEISRLYEEKTEEAVGDDLSPVAEQSATNEEENVAPVEMEEN